MKIITRPDQIPTDTHYAALVGGSIYIPGDNRSREYPGHGYPAITRDIVEYIVFDDETDMKKWVEDREILRANRTCKPYRIIHVKVRKVTAAVTISIQKD